MTDSIKESLYGLCSVLEGGRLDDSARDLLGQSMLYYCSGKDPTPIAAFGAEIPLYVYVDAFLYKKGGFSAEGEELYSRLKTQGFRLTERRSLGNTGRLRLFSSALLTVWCDECGGCFGLLLVEADANRAFEEIYRDGTNYVQPRYICNYRNELSRPELISQAEKRAEFIMGHCHSTKYREVGRFNYLGDYGREETVTLYRRLYYYLF